MASRSVARLRFGGAMKSLFVTLLILSGIFLAYDYYLAAPWERLVFEKGPRPASRGGVATGIPAHEIEDDMAANAEGSARGANAKPQADIVVTLPKIPVNEFVPPQVPSLEELTKDWTIIPAHAFPREVKLRRPVDVKMAAGSARIPAGAAAYARALENGAIIVAPTPTSTARGSVPIADTDLQDQIRQSYAQWKVYRIEKARNAWLAKKTAKPMTNVIVNEPVDVSGALDGKGKPMQNRDGSYPLLLASMQSGQVTDITLKKIRRWGEAEQKVVQGEPLWTVDVWYDTIVYCGPIVAQAQAQIRGGKVVAWVYPSGEPVP